MSLELIEYEVRTVHGCECQISYYKGMSYVTVVTMDTFCVSGKITDHCLSNAVEDILLKNIKEYMCV